jgi:hypothetical protein
MTYTPREVYVDGYILYAADLNDDNTQLYTILNTFGTHKTTMDALNGILVSNGAGVYSAVTNNSTNWNTAYGWGDHSGLYTPIGFKTTMDALNGILVSNGAGVYSAVTNNSTNWNTAYTNTHTRNADTGTTNSTFNVGTNHTGISSIGINAHTNTYANLFLYEESVEKTRLYYDAPNNITGLTTVTGTNGLYLYDSGVVSILSGAGGSINLVAEGIGEPTASNAAESTYLLKEFAESYLKDGSQSLTLTNQNTWYLIDMDTDVGGYDGVTRGAITLEKATSKHIIGRAGFYKITYTFSVGANYNESINFQMCMYKNGAILNNSISQPSNPGAASMLQCSATFLVSLTATDYLQPYIRNITSAGKVVAPLFGRIVTEEI